MVTIVTSLYNIDREKLDGRNWETYLEWFKKTLAINSPMVVFVDSDTKEFVEINRIGKDTFIICEPIENAPYYDLKDSMDQIIKSEDYKRKIKDPNRIECKSSLYNIIQYSKFGWVKKASEIDPFDSELYLWLDAGISRFFEDLGMETGSRYPGNLFLESIKDLTDEVYVQMFMSNYPDLANSTSLSEEYLLDNRSYVAGGIFMSSKKSIVKVKEEIDNVLKNMMLKNGFVNNEQIAVGYLIKKTPSLFRTFRNYSGIHKNYEILKQLNK